MEHVNGVHLLNVRNLKITLAYDGSDYSGWQLQPDRETIQGTLATAIQRVTGSNVLPQLLQT